MNVLQTPDPLHKHEEVVSFNSSRAQHQVSMNL